MGVIAEIIIRQYDNCYECHADCRICQSMKKSGLKIIAEIEKCVPKAKPMFLSNKKLIYEAGIIEGRNQLRAEILSNIKKLKGD